MKKFLKAFLMTFLIATTVLSGAFYGAEKLAESWDQTSKNGKDKTTGIEISDGSKSVALEEYVESKKRLKLLLLGTDGGRSDTIMLFSLGLHDQTVKVLSIPRDTYYPLKSDGNFETKKINAVYGHPEGFGGAAGVKKAVSELLQTEIPYVVEVNYDAVRQVVDVLGGIEYEIPQNMDYDDPYAKPPLHIHLKKGKQLLNGDKAMQFLRWRKNNGEEGLGDMERIKRQQEFISLAVKKAVGLKLPAIIKTAYDNVKTDLSVQEMLYIGSKMIGTDVSAMEKTTLPGTVDMKNGHSYFFVDQELIKQLKPTIE